MKAENYSTMRKNGTRSIERKASSKREIKKDAVKSIKRASKATKVDAKLLDKAVIEPNKALRQLLMSFSMDGGVFVVRVRTTVTVAASGKERSTKASSGGARGRRSKVTAAKADMAELFIPVEIRSGVDEAVAAYELAAVGEVPSLAEKSCGTKRVRLKDTAAKAAVAGVPFIKTIGSEESGVWSSAAAGVAAAGRVLSGKVISSGKSGVGPKAAAEVAVVQALNSKAKRSRESEVESGAEAEAGQQTAKQDVSPALLLSSDSEMFLNLIRCANNKTSLSDTPEIFLNLSKCKYFTKFLDKLGSDIRLEKGISKRRATARGFSARACQLVMIGSGARSDRLVTMAVTNNGE